jgi:hypothetical protein
MPDLDTIIQRIRQLDRQQLEQLSQLIDQLQVRPENPGPAQAPVPEASERA